MKRQIKFTAICILTLILCACGGGGGSAVNSVGTKATSIVTSVGTNTNQVANYAAGDLNGDGLEDVVVSGWNSNIATAYVYVFIQNTDGTLSDKTSQLLTNNVIQGSQRILIGDFDNDGRKDIFVPGFLDGSAILGAHSVMFWGSTSQYVREDWTDLNSAHGACVADMNNDGKLDLLVAGSSYSGAVGGVYINGGDRHFTRNSSVLPADYFEACAAIKTATTNVIYFSGTNSVSGYRDVIATYDYSMNKTSATGLQNDSTLDTIDVVIADLDANGQKDFVLSINGLNINEAGPRKVISNAGTVLYSLETKRSAYHGRALSDSLVFFSGDTNNASLYQGLNKYKSTAFTDMASSTQGFIDAFVYQGSHGKLYMLELLNGTYKTREM